ncbi:MAG: hypothetical protein DMD91_29295 [Candidatus Rokuibacteriota bacterium]|nr:MAG: hypothetical protein DMD91_29295 [Candidatus Rokubacteria bacterium]
MRFPRQLAVVAVLVVAAHSVGAAAQSSLAGVVTLLQGSVTATRTSTAEPVELQLRDGVFSDERIATAANGFARILLGGKAIVTMQERSSVQITEELGTSTLAMSEGRIAVAVARELTKTGELIEIKTPTALATSRGAVVIAEITKGVTTFTVVRGLVDATRVDALTNRPVGPRVMLRANQQVTIPATGLLRPLAAKPGSVQRFDTEFQLGNADGAVGSVLPPLPAAPAPATAKRRPPAASKRQP